MTYRALFVGGPLDAQERVLTAAEQHIAVMGGFTYSLLHCFETPAGPVLLYSIWDVVITLSVMWDQYTAGNCDSFV